MDQGRRASRPMPQLKTSRDSTGLEKPSGGRPDHRGEGSCRNCQDCPSLTICEWEERGGKMAPFASERQGRQSGGTFMHWTKAADLVQGGRKGKKSPHPFVTAGERGKIEEMGEWGLRMMGT